MAKRKSKGTFVDSLMLRFQWVVDWFLQLVKDRDFQEAVFQKLYWLCVLFSLSPLIFSTNGLFGSFNLIHLLHWDGGGETSWLAGVRLWPFGIILLLMVLLPFLSRIPHYVFCAMTPLTAILLSLADQENLIIYKALIILYLVFALYSLGAFALGGRFLSVSVGLFAVFCFADSAWINATDLVNWVLINILGGNPASTFGYGKLVVNYLLDDVGANIIEILAFFVLLVFLRFCVHFVKDNRQIYDQLMSDRKLLKSAGIKALRMWIIVPIIFFSFVYFLYPKIDKFIENTTMTKLQLHLLCEDADGNSVKGCVRYEEAKAIEREYEPMMRALVEHSSDQMAAISKVGIDEIASQTLESVDDVKTKIFPILATRILPPRMPGTAPQGCGRMNIPCHGSNGAKSLINSGYSRLRNPPLRRLEAEIENAYVAANNDVDAFRSKAKALVEIEVAKYRSRAHLAIDKAIFGIWFLSICSLVYGVMILFKTFGIAFARVVFDTNSSYGFSANLSHGGPASDVSVVAKKNNGQKLVIHKKSPFVINADSWSKYYVDNRRQVTGGLGYPSIPFPFKGIFKRFRKNYLMQYYDFSGEKKSAEYGIQFNDQVESVVEIKLNKGEKFIFDFPGILAFSSGLKVKTFVTLSLHGLVFGKAIYRVAEGEGVLVFCINGQPTVLDRKKIDSAENKRDPMSVVAWQLDTPFKIQSKLKWLGLLFSGYNIAKQKGGGALVHNREIPGGGAKMGVSKFLRTFLSPV